MLSMIKIELIARGIIINDGKILLCDNLKKNYYFLPGGHIEEGEDAETALRREMIEEVGREVKEIKKITEIKNSYNDDDADREEIIYVNLVSLENYDSIKSLEDHIGFAWVPLDEFANSRFRPIEIVPEILKCVEEDRGFWE